MNCKLGNLLAILCCEMCFASFASVVHGQNSPADRREAYVTTDASPARFDIESTEILLQALEQQKSPPVVNALAASHDGKYLAAAGDDHAIRIIDVTRNRVLQTYVAHDDWIQSLVFASDSHTLYSAGNDGRVLQWSHKFPVQEEQLLQLPFAIRTLSVSSEKHLLAIGGFSDEINVLDLQTRRIKYRLKCDCGDQRCVKFSPDGQHLLCGGRDGELRVWNTDTGAVEAHFHAHVGRVHMAAFSADGKHVTSVGGDRRLIQYNLEDKQVKLKRDLAQSKLMSMCMVNDDLVAVAGADNSVHLYDAMSDEVIAHLKGHTGTVAVMTPCGNRLASGSFDTTIRIWDLESMDKQVIDLGKPTSHAPIKMDSQLRIR